MLQLGLNLSASDLFQYWRKALDALNGSETIPNRYIQKYLLKVLPAIFLPWVIAYIWTLELTSI